MLPYLSQSHLLIQNKSYLYDSSLGVGVGVGGERDFSFHFKSYCMVYIITKKPRF